MDSDTELTLALLGLIGFFAIVFLGIPAFFKWYFRKESGIAEMVLYPTPNDRNFYTSWLLLENVHMEGSHEQHLLRYLDTSARTMLKNPSATKLRLMYNTMVRIFFEERKNIFDQFRPKRQKMFVKRMLELNENCKQGTEEQRGQFSRWLEYYLQHNV